MNVYLSGPIAGLNYDKTLNWRDYVSNILKFSGISFFSPMRYKEFLQNHKLGGFDDTIPLTSSKGIMIRDFFDCKRSDLIFVNLLDAKIVSIGTVMEIGWAYCMQKPIILVIEDIGNIHDNHPMITEATSYRVNTLDKGMEILKALK